MPLPRTPSTRITALVICIACIFVLTYYKLLSEAHSFHTTHQVKGQQGQDAQSRSQLLRVSLAAASRTQNGIPIYNNTGPTSPPRFLSTGLVQHASLPGRFLEKLRITPAHPRLFADVRRWRDLPELTEQDPYLKSWNKTIFQLATQRLSQPPPFYVLDGTNGILDIAREVQLRIKLWSYAYRTSGGDTRWKQRIWNELVVASGNSTQYFGLKGDNWNSRHWLDVAEFIVAFSYAYDWLYNAWNTTERKVIRQSIIDLGLKKGLKAHESRAWFLSVNGNWNCVTNGAMIIGALAVYHEESSSLPARVLRLAVKNALDHCVQSVESDGTWTETPDYWYFGTQAHAQLASALLSATGSTHGLLTANPAFQNTGMFHIYNYGMTEKFNYGDCGPSKITATANSLLFYANELNRPMYSLYQRDRADVADPLAMLWYNPDVNGSWYHELPLDRAFSDVQGAWVSMRSSWTDPFGLFVAMKAGRMVGHGTHGHLDAGDFVLDAMGERWVGELCQENYNSPGYFSSEKQDSTRWTYYRCRTEGQNTILYDGQNQVADAVPKTRFRNTSSHDSASGGSSGEPFWVADLTNAYNGTVIKRGLRLVGGRKTVLLQDEIRSAERPSQWRVHTNATITYSENGKRAHLRLNRKTLDVLLASPRAATFHTASAARLATGSPSAPGGYGEMENPGVSVLAIDLPPGNSTVAIVFCPVWGPGFTCEMPRIPEAVPLD